MIVFIRGRKEYLVKKWQKYSAPVSTSANSSARGIASAVR